MALAKQTPRKSAPAAAAKEEEKKESPSLKNKTDCYDGFQRQKVENVTYFPVGSDGLVDLEKSDETQLRKLTCMHARRYTSPSSVKGIILARRGA